MNELDPAIDSQNALAARIAELLFTLGALGEIGVGAVFALVAVAAARPVLTWLVCVAHLILAAGFGAAPAASSPAASG